MPLITWDDSLSVKIGVIDEQHKRLIELLNELSDAMEANFGAEALGEILGGLADYTISHFETEERYFAEFGYADAEEHTAEHQRFIDKVAAFKEKYDAGKVLVSIDVLLFLKSWVAGHIKGSDMRYVECFHANGVR